MNHLFEFLAHELMMSSFAVLIAVIYWEVRRKFCKVKR